jgi:DNA-binding protein H-NS
MTENSAVGADAIDLEEHHIEMKEEDFVFPDDMNIDQLRRVKKNLEEKILEKTTFTRSEVILKMNEIAKSFGFNSARDVLLGNMDKRVGKVAPKYVDPKNPKNLWSGRGRTPLWVLDAEEAGYSRADLLIKQPESQDGEGAAEVSGSE